MGAPNIFVTFCPADKAPPPEGTQNGKTRFTFPKRNQWPSNMEPTWPIVSGRDWWGSPKKIAYDSAAFPFFKLSIGQDPRAASPRVFSLFDPARQAQPWQPHGPPRQQPYQFRAAAPSPASQPYRTPVGIPKISIFLLILL